MSLSDQLQSQEVLGLAEVAQVCVRAAHKSGSCDRGPDGCRRPHQSILLKSLIDSRRRSISSDERRELSKQILKQSRRELRTWRTRWADHMLTRMRNTKFLQKINTEPYQRKTCSIHDDEFAGFLNEIFSSDRTRHFHFDKSLIHDIPLFTTAELDEALLGLANLRASDEEGCVVELLKYASSDLKDELLACFNRIIRFGTIDEN